MKPLFVIPGFVLAALLAGCVSAPVSLGPVGPNPTAVTNKTGNGQLQVFSAWRERRDGNDFDINPVWYQHADYNLYDSRGNRVEHVFNVVSHYGPAPLLVNLSPGQYVVKTRDKDYRTVLIPVMIEKGRVTRVHLDGQWRAPAGTSTAMLVYGPNGPIGWQADLANEPHGS